MKSKSSEGPGKAVDRLRATYRYLFKNEDDPGIDTANFNKKVRDSVVSPLVREEMASNLEYASQLGLSIGRLSEASIFLQGNQYLVTRRECSFTNLGDDDLLLVSPGSVMNQSQIPPYWDWHQAIYQAKFQVRAILLGQPSAAMALAFKEEIPDEQVLPDAAKAVGDVFLCLPNVEQITAAAQKANVLFVPGIGVLSSSVTLLQAVENLAIIDHWSEITLKAKN